MNLTDQQRAELKALAEDPFATFGSRTIRALLADLEEHKSEFAKLMQKHNALHINAHETRKQLAEAQADNAAMHSAAHRLALEAECFYLDCKDMALVSKWGEPLQTAISDVQAIRWDGDNSALSAAIEAAVKPYKPLVSVVMYQFLSDVITSAGLLSHGKTDKGLAERINGRAMMFMGVVAALSAKEAP